jgi:hypothetical protein
MQIFEFEFSSCFGTYNVVAGSDFDYAQDENNGVLGVIGPHAFRILCGRNSAPVKVTAYALRQAPAILDPGWEAVAEADLTSEDGDLRFEEAHMGNFMCVPELLLNGAGVYRVRFHIRGRDTAAQNKNSEEPIEEHLFVIWPSNKPQEDQVLLLDESGRRRR